MRLLKLKPLLNGGQLAHMFEAEGVLRGSFATDVASGRGRRFSFHTQINNRVVVVVVVVVIVVVIQQRMTVR